MIPTHPIKILVLAQAVEIIQRLDLEEVKTLIKSGFTPDLCDQLGQSHLIDIGALASTDFLQIRVNPGALLSGLKQIKHDQSVDDLIDDLVMNQAPQGLLCDLFGLQRREVAQRKLALGAQYRNGRPKRLNKAQEKQILGFWRNRKPSNRPEDIATDLLALVKHFESDQISLHEIYPVISNHGKTNDGPNHAA